MASYALTKDRKGVTLHPGDRVRVKTYPRGTAEGIVVVSLRAMEVLPDGTSAPALSMQTAEGTLYPLYEKGTLKLRG